MRGARLASSGRVGDERSGNERSTGLAHAVRRAASLASSVVVVCCGASRVYAEPPATDTVAGTGDDPIHGLAVLPSVVDAPLTGALSIRDGTPDDTRVLVDGFEIPWLFHERGLRSIVRNVTVDEIDIWHGAFGVEHGRGSSIVALTTQAAREQTATQRSYSGFVPWYRTRFEITGLDVGWAFEGGNETRVLLAGRSSGLLTSGVPHPRFGEVFFGDAFFFNRQPAYDAQLRIDRKLSAKWLLTISGIGVAAFNDRNERDTDEATNVRRFARTTATARYRSEPWTATFAASAMPRDDVFERGAQHRNIRQLALDTRAEVVRKEARAFGLTDVEWRLGEQTTMSRYNLDIAMPRESREGSPQPQDSDPLDQSTRFDGIVWTPDAAVWTSLSARLSPQIRATTGLRVDVLRGDLATQPRGQLEFQVSKRTHAELAAGAYRRAPERGEELLVEHLHPERTTMVGAAASHKLTTLATIDAAVYYNDRTRLIMRDSDGALGNTGRGTAIGSEVSVTVRDGPWFWYVATSLSEAVRRDHYRATERPFERDQPFRLDGIVTWQSKRWQLAGRVQLYSGLPTTPIQTAIYDSDRDFYAPIFGTTYSERAPFHHQIDLRVDRAITIPYKAFTLPNQRSKPAGGRGRSNQVELHVFLDLHNAYNNRNALGYRYSYDYQQRIAVALPIFPFIGLRAQL